MLFHYNLFAYHQGIPMVLGCEDKGLNLLFWWTEKGLQKDVYVRCHLPQYFWNLSCFDTQALVIGLTQHKSTIVTFNSTWTQYTQWGCKRKLVSPVGCCTYSTGSLLSVLPFLLSSLFKSDGSCILTITKGNVVCSVWNSTMPEPIVYVGAWVCLSAIAASTLF